MLIRFTNLNFNVMTYLLISLAILLSIAAVILAAHCVSLYHRYIKRIDDLTEKINHYLFYHDRTFKL